MNFEALVARKKLFRLLWLMCVLSAFPKRIYTACASFGSRNDPTQVQMNSAVLSEWSPLKDSKYEQTGTVYPALLLYLHCEVGGQPISAFVDTGAQATVMSERCAQRCGLLGRINTRHAGRAVGVGSARILGRIHNVTLRIGSLKIKFEINVLQNADMDLLIGLDVLRSYKCAIDLQRNSIRFDVGRGKFEEIIFIDKNIGKDCENEDNKLTNRKEDSLFGQQNRCADSNGSDDLSLAGW